MALAPVCGAGGALLARWAAEPDLTASATITCGILLVAGILWATEAISGVATALLAVGLIVGLLGLPASLGAWWMADAASIGGWTQFLEPAGDPVMVLLLGSVTLAYAVSRTGMDRTIGSMILRPFAASPSRLVLGVLLASAWLSMWTSNTATGVLMLSVTRPLWGGTVLDRRVRAGLVMAVAVGANVGGIATPIGTPPNAIVFSYLQEVGHPLNFVQWMALGTPIAVVTLGLGWIGLRLGIGWPTDSGAMDLSELRGEGAGEVVGAPAWTRRVTGSVFVLTVVLWVTGPWTGVPVAAVGLVPLVVLPAVGIVRPSDFGRLEWDVLLLILGGLVLGRAMEDSGLAAQVVGQLPIAAMPPLLVVGMVGLVAIGLSAFMSNTATANLLCPIGFAVAGALEGGPGGSGEAGHGWLTTQVGLAIAMGAGNAMFLPVSTPANALAHRSGLVTTRQFLVVGSFVAAGGLGSVLLLALLRS